MSNENAMNVGSLLLSSLWNAELNVVEAQTEVQEAQKVRDGHQHTVDTLRRILNILEGEDESEAE